VEPFSNTDAEAPSLEVLILGFFFSCCYSCLLQQFSQNGFTIIYFLLCVLYLTCDYVVTHATFLSLFLIFLNPVCL